MKQMTFKQYRTMDILIMVALTIFFEGITAAATSKWFAAQPVALSIGLAMVCVTMFRWGWQAAAVAFAGGLSFCVISGALPSQYLIYCIGNMGAVVSLLWIRRFGKEKILDSIPKILLLCVTAYLGQAAGRWLVSLLFGGKFSTLAAYVATDMMTLVFAVIVILLFRKTEGMLEDQKAYLFRMERERKEAANNPVPPEEEY